MYKIFLVEDDDSIAAAITKLAGAWGFDIHSCRDFTRVLEEFTEYSPDVVLLDIVLPFAGGFHWCGEIRKASKTPIIFISSASDNMNIVMAMNMGADDFIAKPFDGNVLIAKIQAILRRTHDFAEEQTALTHRGATLCDDYTLDFGGERIELTKNEYRILSCLLESKGKVVSREKIMERLWRTDSFVDENTLTVNINRLRKKLDSAGLSGFITTKFGVGYIVE